MISRLTLLLLLLCKDISWKPGGSCCAAPPSSLQRYQPLCFLFCFFFSLLYSVLFLPSLSLLFSSLLSSKKLALFIHPLPVFAPFSSPVSLQEKKHSVSLFRFFLLLLFCIRAVFIGAGGAGSTLPRPIICMGCEAAAPPCHGTG